MERLTEYHAGKAVIKDKSLLPKAMEKLARYEDVEKESKDIQKITTEMMEYICDHVCIAPKTVLDDEQLERYCEECKMGKYVCDICNTYNQINGFVNRQAGKLLLMYRNFVRCDECEYCQEETDCRWCKNKDGLDAHLEPGTGCTRGVKKQKLTEFLKNSEK